MKATVVGGSGYVGGEMVRLLLRHEKIEDLEVTSTKHAGVKVSKIHRNLSKVYDKEFIEYNPKKLDSDVVFLSTPNGESMKLAPEILKKGIKVVDLSADYRLKDAKLYEKFYGWKHESIDLLEDAVYGLPEINHRKIKNARLIANPGCYATSAVLALAPMSKLQDRFDQKKIVVDAKSGSSGAGASPTDFLHHSEVDSNLKPYMMIEHRHRPEIESVLWDLYGSSEVRVSFTPTLMPIVRGILTNVHLFIRDGEGMDLARHYSEFYGREYFVRIVDVPYVKDVVGSNFCDIGVYFDGNSGRILLISALDNLVKGAAGQAVQNMNIMFGFKENEGLDLIPEHP